MAGKRRRGVRGGMEAGEEARAGRAQRRSRRRAGRGTERNEATDAEAAGGRERAEAEKTKRRGRRLPSHSEAAPPLMPYSPAYLLPSRSPPAHPPHPLHLDGLDPLLLKQATPGKFSFHVRSLHHISSI
ncbi:hypothetical protein BS78_08G046400 [Paspalum vaginatum]|nr:hypothetical protein BS78_08G046400 [Paspalum vaginatum]